VPVTVNVRELLPTGRLDGETELAIGCGLPIVIVKGNGGDVPPPGAGFLTEMFRVAACARSLAGRTTWRSIELA
jgi:hypothetical protein